MICCAISCTFALQVMGRPYLTSPVFFKWPSRTHAASNNKYRVQNRNLPTAVVVITTHSGVTCYWTLHARYMDTGGRWRDRPGWQANCYWLYGSWGRVCTTKLRQVNLISQTELNCLVQNTRMSKYHLELLRSRLQEWNLLGNIKIRLLRNCETKTRVFFSVIRCTVIIVTKWRRKRPEYWRPFIDSFKVEYEGRISYWKRRSIIFVGYVLHTKMKSFVKATNQKIRFQASATDMFTDHWCEGKKRGLCQSSHKKRERSWMTGIVTKF